MLSYVIILVALVGLTIHRYLNSFRENRLLPYPIGFNVFTIFFVLFYLASFIWMFGIVAGIIISALCFFQLIHSALLWIFALPWLVKMNKNEEMPEVNRLVYSSFAFIVGVLGIITIINFFVSSYRGMWEGIEDNIWLIVITFVAVMLIGNLARSIVFRKIQKLYNNPEPAESSNPNVPDEIKETYRLLDKVADELKGVDEFLLQEIIKEAIQSLTIDQAQMNDYVKEIRENKRSPQEWVFTYIINDAADKMESGKYHVYRGVLDSTGEAYKAIFERGIRAMIGIGAYSKEWADQHIREPVYSNIKKVG
ncbi:MAG: hypothetical protein JRC93_01785 [Deltaproteobacteria bacterium]|nr:hypothetical protein [Deltaproteobacteria bacterium]